MTRTQEIDLAPRGGLARRLPLLAGAAPVAGALLSWDATGYVHALAAGEAFAGICTRSVRPGGYLADGEGQVDAMTGQFLLSSTGGIAGIDETDVAAATVIYASDDSTFTGTATSNTKIGAVAGFDGARVVVMARTADIASADAPPPFAVPVGKVTFVDRVNGSDATGTPGDQTLPYRTIQGAIDDSAAGDTVVCWPGLYVESVTLKQGVRVHGLAGAIIYQSGAGNYCISDAGGSVDTAGVSGWFDLRGSGGAGCIALVSAGTIINMEILEARVLDSTGKALLIAAGELHLVIKTNLKQEGSGDICHIDGSATVFVEADYIIAPGGNGFIASASCALDVKARNMYTNGSAFFSQAGGNARFNITNDLSNGGGNSLIRNDAVGQAITVEAETISAPNATVWEQQNGWSLTALHARRLISGHRIGYDIASGDYGTFAMSAPKIAATEAGQDGFYVQKVAAVARYDIRADALVCSITFRPTQATVEMHIETGSHQSHTGSGSSALSLQNAGKTFYRCHELDGIAGAPHGIYMQDTATLHLLGGRIRGLDGDAGGHAILTSGAGCKPRLYPGTVLIAGDDAAAVSIEADNTPTVLAMGDIAANKAANGGVVVAVGSLLVDAAVA